MVERRDRQKSLPKLDLESVTTERPKKKAKKKASSHKNTGMTPFTELAEREKILQSNSEGLGEWRGVTSDGETVFFYNDGGTETWVGGNRDEVDFDTIQWQRPPHIPVPQLSLKARALKFLLEKREKEKNASQR